MTITVRCRKCGNKYRVAEKHLGKPFRCKRDGCNTITLVELTGPDDAASEKPAPRANRQLTSTAAPRSYLAPPVEETVEPSLHCCYCRGVLINDVEVAGQLVECTHCERRLLMPPLGGLTTFPPPALPMPLPSAVPAPIYVGDDFKDCPMCGETIKTVAKRCKHCGETLDPMLRKIEEGERRADRSERQGGGRRSSSSVVVVNSGGGGSNVGLGILLEIIFSFFQIFGIGHFVAGSPILGILFLLGWWGIVFANLVLAMVFSLVTIPICWFFTLIVSVILIAACGRSSGNNVTVVNNDTY